MEVRSNRLLLLLTVCLFLQFSSSYIYGEESDDPYKKLHAFYKRGEFYEALAECERMVEEVPDDARSHAHLGYCYYATGDNDKAIESFEKAIALRPSYTYPAFYIPLALFADGRYDLCIIESEEFLERFPGSKYEADAVQLIGDSYSFQQKHTLAIEVYNRLLDDYPTYERIEQVKISLADAYYANQRYTDVIAVLEEFMEVHPESEYLMTVYSLLSEAYGKEGMADKSAEMMMKIGFFYPILFIVLFGAALIMLIVVAGIYGFGSFIKRGDAEKTKPSTSFRLFDVLCVVGASMLLPYIVAPIIGKLFYGHSLIGLVPSPRSVEGVYTMCASTAVSYGVLTAIILWLVFKRYGLSRRDVGFTFRGITSVTTVPLLAMVLVEVIDTAYGYFITNILNITIPDQYLTLVVQSIETFGQVIILFISAVILAPVVEEIIFRVFLYNAFKRYTNVKWGIVFSAFFFAVYHFEWMHAVPLFFLGIVLAYTYERTKSILPAIIIHAFNNLIFFAIVRLGV